MSKKLDEICELIAVEVGHRATARTAKEYGKGFYKVFLNQLKMNGKISIPKFGTFTLLQKQEKVIKVGDPHNGGTKYVHVRPRYYLEFTPSSFLDRSINDTNFKMSSKKVENIKSDSRKKEKENPTMCYTVTEMFNRAQNKIKEKEK